MIGTWRIGTFNGVLLALYFIPTWSAAAFRIMISPVHALYEKAHIGPTLFMSDHVQVAGSNLVRFAWLFALAKLTVAIFFGLFLLFATRRSLRLSRGCDEALAFALGIGCLVSFSSMLMASRVGAIHGQHLHATEALMLICGGVLLLAEPFFAGAPRVIAAPADHAHAAVPPFGSTASG